MAASPALSLNSRSASCAGSTIPDAVLDDRGRRVERGLDHLLHRQRAAQHRRGLVEPLVLVLRALDRAEHLLGLHHPQHLRAGVGQEVAIGLGERRLAVGRQDPAQVAVLDQRHRDQRQPGAPRLVVRQLPGLGRRAQQRLAIAHHRAEDPGRRQPRQLGDVVGVRRDLLELDPLAVVVEPQQRHRHRPERSLQRAQHPARGVADHPDPADREQPLLLVAPARRPAARPQRRRDQPVVARRVAQRAELLVEPRRPPPPVARGQPAQQHRVRRRRPRQVRRVDRRRQQLGRGDPPAQDQRRLEQHRRRQRRDRARPRQHRHRERHQPVQQRIRRRAQPAGHRDHDMDPRHQRQRQLEVGQIARRGQPERHPLGPRRRRRELHPPDHRHRHQPRDRHRDHRHRQARPARQHRRAIDPAGRDHRARHAAGDRPDRDLQCTPRRALEPARRHYGASGTAGACGNRSTISSGYTMPRSVRARSSIAPMSVRSASISRRSVALRAATVRASAVSSSICASSRAARGSRRATCPGT
jgi:hypothetical protein